MRRLLFEPVVRGRRHLVLRYSVDDLLFSTTYWYDDVDFLELEARHGSEWMRRVYFHILAFEANKAAAWHRQRSTSGRTPIWPPTRSGISGRRSSVTCGVCGGMRTIYPTTGCLGRRGIDARRRTGRRSVRWGEQAPRVVRRREGQPGQHEAARAGGDRLPHIRLLPLDLRAGPVPARLIDGLVAHCDAQVHRAWVIDDAFEAPIAQAYPDLGIRRIVSAETVSSYWLALPVALPARVHDVALGITRSTDEHNLVWDKTGEEINYLWGMSADAERLLHDYVRRELVSDLRMFHLLRPIYDVNVFSLLRRDPAAVPPRTRVRS